MPSIDDNRCSLNFKKSEEDITKVSIARSLLRYARQLDLILVL
jgi:hypothetical protein